MGFEDLAQAFPDFPYLLQVEGSAFDNLMGPEWTRLHPKVPLQDQAAAGSTLAVWHPGRGG